MWYNVSGGRVAELVYAFDLKSNGETRTGSSPVSATIFVVYRIIWYDNFFVLVKKNLLVV